MVAVAKRSFSGDFPSPARQVLDLLLTPGRLAGGFRAQAQTVGLSCTCPTLWFDPPPSECIRPWMDP